MKKYIFFIAAFLVFLLISTFAHAGDKSVAVPKLIVFFSPGCHKCIEVKSQIMPQIEKEFSGRINIEYRDLIDIENYKLLLALQEKYKSKLEFVTPIFFFEGKFLNGKGEIRGDLKKIISTSLVSVHKEEILPEIDLVARFKGFRFLAITAAGLQDGINPCAFTVIVFFISFLALQGYRKMELVVIGSAFIFAVFVTYFLLGLGLFNFIYSLKGFRIVTKALNTSIGALSIIFGFMSIYDFLKFRKTGDTEGLLLQLPQAVKHRIHSVIGMHYRKSKDSGPGQQKQRIFMLLLSALITGFLVCILEAVCTGQLYLPTITFVFKTTPLKFQALLYLLYYNLLFVAPLFAILLFALFGVTSEQFSKFLKKHLLSIKILMAIMFFGLGLLLIWRA